MSDVSHLSICPIPVRRHTYLRQAHSHDKTELNDLEKYYLFEKNLFLLKVCYVIDKSAEQCFDTNDIRSATTATENSY